MNNNNKDNEQINKPEVCLRQTIMQREQDTGQGQYISPTCSLDDNLPSLQDPWKFNTHERKGPPISLFHFSLSTFHLPFSHFPLPQSFSFPL